ncbi:MAG: HAD family hydrolase [Nitriliruptorales bacterium]|nr:HAD family hydrolase [Nitriliruptorales bacterium]
MQVPPGLVPGGRFDEWSPSSVAYCVADVDGTLVGNDNTPNADVCAAVREAQAAGVLVGVATGRMRLSAEPVARAIGSTGPHVLHNGAEVRRNGQRLDAWPLTTEQLETVLAIGNELGAYAEIYVDDGYLVTRDDERALPHWQLLGREPLGVLAAATDLSDVPLKATFAVFDDLELADAVSAAVAAHGLGAGSAHSPVTPGISYINVTHPAANKGAALAVAAEHAGTDLSGTAAIGDAHNDISMLLRAGTAIAMGQAHPDVRAAAHLVAPAVADDGAAVSLRALAHL